MTLYGIISGQWLQNIKAYLHFNLKNQQVESYKAKSFQVLLSLLFGESINISEKWNFLT